MHLAPSAREVNGHPRLLLGFRRFFSQKAGSSSDRTEVHVFWAFIRKRLFFVRWTFFSQSLRARQRWNVKRNMHVTQLSSLLPQAIFFLKMKKSWSVLLCITVLTYYGSKMKYLSTHSSFFLTLSYTPSTVLYTLRIENIKPTRILPKPLSLSLFHRSFEGLTCRSSIGQQKDRP